MGNGSLAAAKAARDDEFYTRIEDIETELAHYTEQLRGKRVLCGCDDPERSMFWRYFHTHFSELGLGGLAAVKHNPDGFGYAMSYDGGNDGDWTAGEGRTLSDDGDFRSAEMTRMLEDYDIIVTNPPFSLFRHYVSTLIWNAKDFLLVGSLNAAVYKEVFPFIESGRIRLGHTHVKSFLRPDGSEEKMGNAVWYTTLGVVRPAMQLLERFSDRPGDYFRYDNYDAIECGSVRDVPGGYYGTMGVPVSFLERHCPEQFEITGVTKAWMGIASKKYGKQVQVCPDGRRKACMKLNDQPARLRRPEDEGTYYECGGKEYVALYQRVLIRRKAAGEILDFIKHFSGAMETFTSGCCYWFAYILSERFPGAVIEYMPVPGHFIASIGGRLYDVTGDVTEAYENEFRVRWDGMDSYDPEVRRRVERDCVLKSNAEG